MKNTSAKIILLISLLMLSSLFWRGVGGEVFAQTAEVKIKTSAICDMCKARIERDLLFEKGVKKATLNLDDKVVTVVYNTKKTDEQKIRVAITKTGYDANSLAADTTAYKKLPDCCKKESGMH